MNFRKGFIFSFVVHPNPQCEQGGRTLNKEMTDPYPYDINLLIFKKT